jgi:HK97 family phage major capsid protein
MNDDLIAGPDEIRRRFESRHGTDADPRQLAAAMHEARQLHEDALEGIHRAAGDRSLTASEQRRWDAHTRAARQLEEAAAELEHRANAEREARVAEHRARWGSVQVSVGGSSAAGLAPAELARMSRPELRSAALRTLDDRRATAHLSTEQADHVDALLRTTSDRNLDPGWIARAMLLSETPAYHSAFAQVLLDPHPVLTGEEARALRAYQEFRAMSEGSGAVGLYGVPVLIDPIIILTGQQSLNPFMRIASVRTITNDVWRGVSSAGVSWSWDAEASPVSDDSPTLAQPTVPVHTARGFIPYSIELGMDYPNLAGELGTLLAEGYAELTAAAFATGSGDGQPIGILTALDANTNVEVSPTTAGAFVAADIDKVWTALPDRAKGSATWVMSHDVLSHIALWGDALGSQTTDLTRVPNTLRGRPVEPATGFPAFTGTTGAANILVVGDFGRGFVIAQRAGMAVEPIAHLFDTTTGLPTGQRGLFAHARVGSDSVDDLRFRLLQNQ